MKLATEAENQLASAGVPETPWPTVTLLPLLLETELPA
jgi:hypothetical protein